MSTETQTEFQQRAGGASQCDVILRRLQEAPESWVGALELHQLSGSLAVHSRISDLRGRGHDIQQRCEMAQGQTKHSYYRLMNISRSISNLGDKEQRTP